MKTEYNNLYELMSRYEQYHMPIAGADFAEEDDDEEAPAGDRPSEFN